MFDEAKASFTYEPDLWLRAAHTVGKDIPSSALRTLSALTLVGEDPELDEGARADFFLPFNAPHRKLMQYLSPRRQSAPTDQLCRQAVSASLDELVGLGLIERLPAKRRDGEPAQAGLPMLVKFTDTMKEAYWQEQRAYAVSEDGPQLADSLAYHGIVTHHLDPSAYAFITRLATFATPDGYLPLLPPDDIEKKVGLDRKTIVASAQRLTPAQGLRFFHVAAGTKWGGPYEVALGQPNRTAE